MKVLLVVIALTLFSSTTFAQSISEFERGYQAGEQTCSQDLELWSCTVKSTYGAYNNTDAAEGSSRAKALTGLLDVCRNYGFKEFALSCVQAVRDQKAVCIKL